VLRVSRPQNVAVCVEADKGGHVAADLGEVGDDTIVHKDVAAEDEGVRVYLCDDASAAGANMCEDALSLGVFA
jgi:hypothetical protein